jgi:predicted RNA-binding protein (virulence factor B family)
MVEINMIKIGQFNKLMVIKEVPFGVYLDGKEYGEILLPKKYVPKNACVQDLVNVFIYFDSSDQIIATTQKPYAELGKCAFLKVIDVNPIGAFLDWGLDKDLLVPRPEQKFPMEKNKSYVVYLKQDQQGRIIASSKLDHFLDKSPCEYAINAAVDLIIAQKTELGYKVIINHQHWGLLHTSDLFQKLNLGQRISGFIKKIREDGKIDVVLRKPCAEGRLDLAERIISELEKANGFLPLHDKSSPKEIADLFGESKKRFKDAIGQLYKQGKILIESNGIQLKSD